MSEKKDFLDQFSNQGKPASFQEEKRVEVKKEKKPINKKALIIAGVALLAVLGILYYVFLAPKIEVPNFVYQTKTDVVAWVKQQGIETTGIVFDEEYSFDYDDGTVLSQNIQAGTKVKKDVKMNFVLSKGADPDELITVPDLQSMTKTDIKEWISENKLTKTKISTQYSDNVEEDLVIDYKFTGCDEDSFTRSSTLKINVSKGPQPAGTVTVEDFNKKTYEQAEAWAKTNKVVLIKNEAYSEKIEKGLIISQSVEAGKNMNEGETLEVTVSLGKNIIVPDFTSMSENERNIWSRENGITFLTEEVYDNHEKGTVLKQKPSANTSLGDKDYVEIKVSIGDPVYPGCTTLDELEKWVDEVNEKEAEIKISSVSYELSDTVTAGNIISINPSTPGATSHIKVVISSGKNIWLQDMPADVESGAEGVKWSEISDKTTEDQIRALCEFNKVNYKVSYKSDDEVEANHVISVTRDGGKTVSANTYISEAEVINVVISTGK